MYKTIVPLTLAMALSMPSLADEASVKKAVEGKLGGAVTSVTKTPYLGLYEVYVDGQIVYTDEKVSALLLGALIDGKTMKNVTDGRMQKLTAIKFADLPLALAVKQVRGDGKRVLATFEDPNCGYCKKMAREIAKLDNVTIYTFLYPLESLHPEAKTKAVSVWCAPNKAKAWSELMLAGKKPKLVACNNPVNDNLVLGSKLGVVGTPTLIAADGRVLPGSAPAEKIDQWLNAGKPAAPAATQEGTQ